MRTEASCCSLALSSQLSFAIVLPNPPLQTQGLHQNTACLCEVANLKIKICPSCLSLQIHLEAITIQPFIITYFTR